MANCVAAAPECWACGIVDPPPEETCQFERFGGIDHYIGIHPDACPYCCRLRAACVLRPCSTFQGNFSVIDWSCHDRPTAGPGAGRGHWTDPP